MSAKWTAHKINVRDWCVMSDDRNKPIHVTVEKAFGESDTDVEARTRLITAAPELLAALQTVVTQCEGDLTGDELRDYLHKIAVVAIAKSKGK